MLTLAERLEALRNRPGTLKPEASLLVERSILDLRARGLDRVPKVGEHAPEFALPDTAGRTVRLSDLRAGGPVVLVFYRGSWCPYCNEELAALADAAPQFREAGATLVALSAQRRDLSAKFVADKRLPFAVLEDDGVRVAESYGLAYDFPQYQIELYRDTFRNDLTQVNADGKWRLSIPARFVIDRDGVVRNVRADPDYRYRPEPTQTLAVLQTLAQPVS